MITIFVYWPPRHQPTCKHHYSLIKKKTKINESNELLKRSRICFSLSLPRALLQEFKWNTLSRRSSPEDICMYLNKIGLNQLNMKRIKWNEINFPRPIKWMDKFNYRLVFNHFNLFVEKYCSSSQNFIYTKIFPLIY